MIYWNCVLDGANLSAVYRNPINYIAEGTQTKKWRALRDEFLKSVTSLEFIERQAFYRTCAASLAHGLAASA
jgi:hypothetical protein